MVLVDDKGKHRMTRYRLYNSLVVQHTATILVLVCLFYQHARGAASLFEIRGLIELLLHSPQILEHIPKIELQHSGNLPRTAEAIFVVLEGFFAQRLAEQKSAQDRGAGFQAPGRAPRGRLPTRSPR